MSEARLTRSPALACMTAMLCASAGNAQAQLGASLSLQSDARFRGVSLSDGQPQAALAAAYDGSEGWYGGAMLTQVHFGHQPRRSMLLGYIGRVLPVLHGLDVEAGLTRNLYSGGTDYNYSEAYAGLLGEFWNCRLSYSPDYYGFGRSSLYFEAGLNAPLGASLQAFVHAGTLSQPAPASGPRSPARVDTRSGATWHAERLELSLAWVTVDRSPYAGPSDPPRRLLVFGALTAF